MTKMMEKLRYYTLLCFRDINENDKKISNEALNINTISVGNTTETVWAKAWNVVNGFGYPRNAHITDVLNKEQRECKLDLDIIRSKIAQLDKSDPLYEANLTRLRQEMVEIKGVSANFAFTMAKNGVEQIDSDSKRAHIAHNYLVYRHEQLADKHVKNIENGAAIQEELRKKSSLVDDFANPNLEMPSYMDPED